MRLKAVWNLLLQVGSEGPTLISCAASWRTFAPTKLQIRQAEECEDYWLKVARTPAKISPDRRLWPQYFLDPIVDD
jgi:hypothetical protein